MRGDDLWTVTVRTPDGELKEKLTPHRAWSRRRKLLGLPLVRGPIVLADSLVIGLKALNFSAEEAVAFEMAKAESPELLKSPELSGSSEIDKSPPLSKSSLSSSSQTSAPASSEAAPSASFETAAPAPSEATSSDTANPPRPDLKADPLESFPAQADPKAKPQKNKPHKNKPHKDKPALGNLALGASLAAGICLALVLFVALPHVLSLLLGNAAGFDERGILFHLVDGILKFAILILYIKAIALMPEIGRLYAYHGAEHKAIHVYEARLPLTPEAAKPFPTWHPRCGTAFLFLVLALSVLFFAIAFPVLFRFESLGRFQAALAGVGVKMALMLPLSALAYELTRLAAKRDESRVFAAMIWPGLVLQRLTTREPNPAQLEVAIHSLKSVLAFTKAPAAQGVSAIMRPASPEGAFPEAANGH